MSTKPYHYTECGLDNIYLVNGFEITGAGDNAEIFIHDINGLHKLIGTLLIRKPGLLSGKEIKFIRTSLDFSQTTLGQLLGYDYQSVLRWEKNNGDMPAAADRLLKILFFEFLYPEKNPRIRELINDIAEAEAKKGEVNYKKIQLEEISNEWQRVA